jgi:hypothetical protein
MPEWSKAMKTKYARAYERRKLSGHELTLSREEVLVINIILPRDHCF